MSSQVKVVIPARYASSRLPGKPLLQLGDKIVLSHVIDRCVEAGFDCQDIVVATDDVRILNAMRQTGVSAILTDPSHNSGTDRIAEVCHKLSFDDDWIVLNVQGDEPFIPPALIRQVSDMAIYNKGLDIVTAVTKFVDWRDFSNQNHVKAIISHRGRALYFTRAMSPYCRDEPSSYQLAHRHIGIYAYRSSSLIKFCELPVSPLEGYEKLEQLRALEAGMSIGAVVYNGLVPHGVDTENDYNDLLSMV